MPKQGLRQKHKNTTVALLARQSNKHPGNTNVLSNCMNEEKNKHSSFCSFMMILRRHIRNLGKYPNCAQTWSKNVVPSVLPTVLRLRMMSGAKRAVSEKLLCPANPR